MKLGRVLLVALFISGFAFAQDPDQEFQDATNSLNALYDSAVQFRTSLADAQAQNAQLTSENEQLKQQLAAATQTVFDHLENGPFTVNCGAIVGGSGNAAGNFFPSLIEVAELNLKPAANQYGDCFFRQSFGAHPELSKFTYDVRFLFPSAADAQASQALELDLKQPIGGLMFQFAAQLEFSGNQIRYWTPQTKWTSFNPLFKLARFQPGVWYELIAVAHHDTSMMWLDSMSLMQCANESCVPDATHQPVIVQMSQSWLAPATNWSDNLHIAEQLDGNSQGAAYRVKHFSRVIAQ